jgi:glycosyltransferase involved in cell wall biosynthesis
VAKWGEGAAHDIFEAGIRGGVCFTGVREMTVTARPRVVVIMPAYNAARTLSACVADVPRAYVDEIVLVDDASRDDTVAIARELGLTVVVHPENRGYGGNQKTCYREALARGGEIVVMVHPDHQYDPQVIPQLLEPLVDGRADAVFGSRMLGGTAREGGMPWWKVVANVGLTRLENLVLGLDLTEYHSGFRAYSRTYLEAVNLEANSDGFVFDSEIIAQGVLAGMRIAEIPIATRYFPEASQIGFGRSVLYGLGIVRLMVRFALHARGRRQHPQLAGRGPIAPGRELPARDTSGDRRPT